MIPKELYTVAGSPILHSKSPQLFNHLFEISKLNSYYTRISPDNIEELVYLIKNIGFKGLNITSPFKESIIKEMDDIDGNAKIINSVNTITNINNQLKGYNTDYTGILNIIRNKIGNLKDKICLVLGAGGAARSVVFALKQEQGYIFILNRTFSKAEELAKEFNCNALSFNEMNNFIEKADIIISTVNPDNFDFISQISKKNVTIIDAIYHNSVLKRFAEKNGINYIPGEEWLIEQGLKSFKMFTGYQPDYDLEKKAIYTDKLFINKDNLILIGFSGSGKTETGKILAEKLNYKFIDIDSIIENEENQSISDIFNSKGEDYFRIKETELLTKISNVKKHVISCGGGIIMNPQNRELLRKTGIVIWLYCPLETCMKRIDINIKPLLNKDNYLLIATDLLKERLPLYCYYSDLVISSDKSVNKIAETITKEYENL